MGKPNAPLVDENPAGGALNVKWGESIFGGERSGRDVRHKKCGMKTYLLQLTKL
jgi:hypothetical protein